MNTWPNGVRRAMSQCKHKSWNANNYPGTIQLCSDCEEPTDRCEDDSIYADNDEDSEHPLCIDCYHRKATERTG